MATGWLLIVHGWGKVTRGAAPYIKPFKDLGFDPALPWIYSALVIEFVGGIAIFVSGNSRASSPRLPRLNR